VTINLQAIIEEGSLSSASCSWDYGDGYNSTSCNPHSHTFHKIGQYEIVLTITDQCGKVLIRTLDVIVHGEKGSSSSASETVQNSGGSTACTPSVFSGIIITRFLPNPSGNQYQEEWIEVQNMMNVPADVCGWFLDDSEGGSTPFSLDGFTLFPQEKRVFKSQQTHIALNNDSDEVRLLAPQRFSGPTVYGKIQYRGAKKDQVYVAIFAFADVGNTVTVTRIIDGDTLEGTLHEYTLPIRLIGIDAAEMKNRSGIENSEGIYAKNFLTALLENKNVELLFDTNMYDIYGRILAYVHI